MHTAFLPVVIYVQCARWLMIGGVGSEFFSLFFLPVTTHVRHARVIRSYDYLFYHFLKDVHIYNNEEKYTDEGNFSKKTPN
jgi:hypothetical protein